MTDERKKYGAAAERRAADFLKQKGYEIVATNWRCRLGEIDIIARSGGVLAICEVKARHSDRFGTPLEAITADKQARLRRLGEFYWTYSTDRSLSLRFDAIAVSDDRDKKIDHIEGAF